MATLSPVLDIVDRVMRSSKKLNEKKTNGTLGSRLLPVVLPLAEYGNKATSFSDLLPYGVKIADDIILNTDGSMTATYRYRGSDMNSSSGRARHQLSDRVNEAIRQFGPEWMILVTSDRMSAVGYPAGSNFPDATSAIIDSVRQISYDEEDRHFITEYWIDLTYLPASDSENTQAAMMLEGTKTRGAAFAAAEALKVFNQHLRMFEGLIKADLNLKRVGIVRVDGENGEIEVDEQLAHYIKCATNRDIAIQRLPEDTHLAPQVACMPLRGGFRLRIGSQLVSVVVVSEMPNASYSGMFDVLNRLAYAYRVSWRYIVRDNQAAIKEIQTFRRAWFGKRRGVADALNQKEGRFQNVDAVNMAEDANDALTDCNSGEASFGYFTMSVVFWEQIHHDETEEDAWDRLTKTTDAVTAYFHQMHFQTFFEQENAIEAFLGTLPAIGHAQIRKPMLSSRNLSHFIPTTAVWTGEINNPCSFYPPESPPLAYVSTNGYTPFAFNIHVGDVGHFMVTGDTGSGKSVLLGFLLAQHRRYAGSRQIVFDVGRSHYALCMGVGGKHYEVGADSVVSFAPLAYIDEPAERQWAEGWLASLLARRNCDPVAHRTEIFKALEVFARGGPPYSMTNFMASTHLTQEVRDALSYYTLTGGSGGVLDAEWDTMDVADFICFEMSGLMDSDAMLKEPVLTYLFHFVERICTGRPTILLLEEVWTFLDSDQAADAMKKWLKTLRKANVAVGFANQSLHEFIDSKLADTLIGSCPTKIMLANPSAASEQAARAYRQIGITDWQIRQIARGTPKRDYYVVSPEGRRMISLDLTKVELAFVGVSGKKKLEKLRAIITDEQAALNIGMSALINRIPWQAMWLVDEVSGEKGQGWAKAWLRAWNDRGGWDAALATHESYDQNRTAV